MPLLSVANNVTVKELYKGRAKFLCPSEEEWEEWGEGGGLCSTIAIAKGIVTIQEQVSQDGSVYVVNYMGVDRLNGRILHGLPILRRNIHGIPILRRNKSVYFEKSSTTTRGNRRTTTFALKFETIDKAEEFEVFWLSLNGSIGFPPAQANAAAQPPPAKMAADIEALRIQIGAANTRVASFLLFVIILIFIIPIITIITISPDL